jgi:catechol 2,3-dioxygenase
MSEGISPAAKIGAVALTVSDLERSIDFYTHKMGLKLVQREDSSASLGSGGRAWLDLHGRPGAKKPPKTSGLYHFAVLVPGRLELAQTLRRLAEADAPIGGAADHGVSEALYLSDPDENGIEIYRDRPREEWKFDEQGRVEMGPDPLDIDGLVALLETNPQPAPEMAAETRVGHVHLHVANLAKAEVFYTGVLGFKLMQRYGAQAAFLSAGGYHHHIGINTWAGVGAPPPPAGSVGLRYFEILLPDSAEVERVTNQVKSAGVAVEERPHGPFFMDPSGNGIMLVSQQQ